MRNDRPAHVDLFSGIGGFALAARWAGVETVAFCEIEPYAQRVLRKNFPGVPIIEDVRNFPADEFQRPWLITGGYPCQPFSQAGQRRGAEDDRHLWPAMFEIIRSCRPAWVLAENVAGHVSMGLDEVLSDLESEDYACQPIIVPACAVDAPHRRDRVWVIANANSNRRSDGNKQKGKGTGKRRQKQFDVVQNGCVVYVANADRAGCKERRRTESVQSEYVTAECGSEDVSDTNGSGEKPSWNDWGMGRVRKPIEDSGNHDFERWLPEPDVGRVAHGIPSRVDRLRGLGNAIVPQVAYEIIKAMLISNGT